MIDESNQGCQPVFTKKKQTLPQKKPDTIALLKPIHIKHK